MKSFNSFLIICTFLAIGIQSQAQSLKEYKVKASNGTLTLDGIDDVEIVGYNGNEIVFSSEVENSDHSDRKAGLRLLNAAGLNDNTEMGIAVAQNGNQVSASQITSDCDCNTIMIKVPNSMSIYITHSSHDAGGITVKDFEGELEISTNHHEIILDNVTGPMAVKTLYGSIEGKFKKLSQRGSVSIYSVYELVDISLPKDAKANLSLSTPYGDVYSNASIQMNAGINVSNQEKGYNSNSCGSSSSSSKSSSTISGTLNGGGVEFSIKSSYEDIYLRQL